MEQAEFEEMVHDMGKPYSRHNGIDELLRYFGVSFRKFDVVRFRNGYSKDAPAFTVPLKSITVENGNDKWGADHGLFSFVL